jgi:hypothetical protein
MIDEMDRRALIFLHIPKTAGTTLNRIIEWQYSPPLDVHNGFIPDSRDD